MISDATSSENSNHRIQLGVNQELIWVGQQLLPDKPIYEVHYVYDFGGEVDAVRFADSFKSLVRCNPILRTVSGDDLWTFARPAPPANFVCRVIDVSESQNPRDECESRIERRRLSSFNQTQSLCEAVLYRLSVDSWVLHLTLHHVISDAFCGRSILSQMSRLYGGFNLPDSADSLDLYQVWTDQQRSPEAINAKQRYMDWWRTRSRSTAGTAFYRTSAVPGSPNHTRVVVRPSDEDNQLINGLLTQKPYRQITDTLSQYNTFATALISWLARLTDDSEVTIGATTHGRDTPDHRDAIGLFMQLLPFRVEVDDPNDVHSISRNVAKESIGFFSNAQAGVMTAESLRSFDVALNLIDLEVDDFCGIPTSMRWLHNGYGDPNRRLTVSPHRDFNGHWEFVLDFNDACFDQADRSRFEGQFLATLRAMDQSCLGNSSESLPVRALARDPSTTCALSPPAEDSRPPSLWKSFVAASQENPSACAIQGVHRVWTYEELQHEAVSLSRLIDQAFSSRIVPLVCGRSENTVLAFLAIMASGRCAMIVDNEMPPARRQQILGESDSLIHLDATGKNIKIEHREDGRPFISSIDNSACYIIFTSGSSGMPNGVIVGHDSVDNLLSEFEKLAPLERTCKCSWWTNIGFDVSIYEVFSALLYGRQLCVVPQHLRLDSGRLLEWMQEQRIQSAYLPPFHIEAVTQWLRQNGTLELKRLLVGVEPIPQDRLALIAERIPGINLINGYGPTETTVCATLHAIDPNDHDKGPASIGKPVAGNQIRIVDAHGHPVPDGVAGELQISGVGLATGYLNNPELTQERFLIETESGGFSRRWYRTGDRVRSRPDGNLQFAGRIDDQLKIAGIRVEPGEIASAVKRIAGVEDCFVFRLRATDSSSQLVAVVQSQNPELDQFKIREQLRDRLLPAAIPTHFYVLESIPRKESGKVDRERVEQWIRVSQQTQSARSEKAPRTPVEFTLVSLIREIIGIDCCGVDEDFFSLGGSSLDAMSLVQKARDLDIEISVDDVLRSRTVEEIAAKICDRNIAAAVPHTDTCSNSQPESEHSLSPGARDIWCYQELHPESCAYHYQVRLRCHENLDRKLIQSTFSQIVDRHPALRSVIDSRGKGEPYRIARHDLPLQLEYCADGASEEQILSHGTRPFNLKSASPFRVLHVHRDQGDELILTLHHIAVDERAIQEILREFALLYRGESLPPAGPRRILRHQEPDLDWWVDWLDECELEISLPTNRDLNSFNEDRGRRFRFDLPPDLSEQIRIAAAQLGVSLNCFCISAFGAMLAQYCDRRNIAIGVPVINGLQAGEDPVDYCLSTLPLPCRVQWDASVANHIAQVQDDIGHLLNKADTDVAPLRQQFGTLFNTMFVMRKALPAVQLTQSVSVTPQVSDLGVAKFDLTWFVEERPDHLECEVEFSDLRFESATVREMSVRWQEWLRGFVSSPTQRLRDIKPRTPADENAKRLLNENACTGKLAVSQTVTELIDNVADRFPDRIAIRNRDQQVTYRDLSEKVDRLAHRLNSDTSEISDAVALCQRNSVEALISILGILKSRRAYVPLDPSVGRKRIRQILDSSGVNCVIGSEPWLSDSCDVVLGASEVLAFSSIDSSESLDCIETPSLEDLAYIIHTSGSTGVPKGVAIQHGALTGSTLARNEFYRSAPNRFLLVSPNWFDSSIAGIFWTLCSGGLLVVANDEDTRDLHRMADLIESEQITDTLMLPSLYSLLLRHTDASKLSSLRRVIVAGESCSRGLVDEHYEAIPQAKLFNEYGPTEASVWATAHELTPDDTEASIGKSAPGSLIALLDQQLGEVPIGAIGELFLGGSRLAKGYVGDESLTLDRFIEDPREGHTGRLYRTGDLARLREDGTLLFLGRRDGQLKINGRRTEPGEIESMIRDVQGVHDAVVAHVELPRETADDIDSIFNALSLLPQDVAEELLVEAGSQCFADDASRADDSVENESVELEQDGIKVSIEFTRKGIVATPRKRQRAWLLDRLLREAGGDIAELDRLAKRFVPGNADPHLPRDLSKEQLSDQEIMEDWQTPLMQSMANWACESHGDVLEIGFGRGVAATMIQDNGVRSHTIIEMNPHSIRDHFQPWAERFRERSIRLVEGRWQDVIDELDVYDAVFFHAFPMNETEFIDYVSKSSTFAEHFFPVAAKLLRPGGVFTYLSTEIDSLGRQHQRSLLQHFGEIQTRIQPLSVPADTKDAWWADSMVLVRAIK